KNACEKIFKALTDRVSDPRGVRRPTTLAGLRAVTGLDPELARRVIDVFREPKQSFLTPISRESSEAARQRELTDDSVIDISHESLMRLWRRAEGWAEGEARAAELYRRLQQHAVLHARGERGVLRDPELATARSWRARDEPTAAWGERYAPGFEQALAFLELSTRAARWRRGAVYAGIGAALGATVALFALAAIAAEARAKEQTLQAALAGDRSKLAEADARASAERAREAQARAATLGESNAKLEAQIEAFRVRNPTMREEVVTLRREARSSILGILELREENLILESQIAALTKQRNELDAGLNALARELAELREQELELEQSLKSERAKTETLRSKLEAANQRRDQLEAEHGRLRSALLDAGYLPVLGGDVVSSITGEGSASVGASSDGEATLVSGPDPLALLTQKNAQLRARLQAFQDEARLLELLGDELMDWKQRLEGELATVRETNTELKRNRDALRTRIRALQAQLKATNAERRSLLENVETLARQRETFRSESAGLRRQIAATDRLADRLSNENEHMKRLLRH
ncbi:MAG TPA: hypothetical protein VK509_20545, partial [Polyangiales bacterium]|nr:hypothetical protein [Polyangiales bacterium]